MKKVITAILAFILILGIFGACSSSPTTSTPTAAPTETPVTEVKADPTPAPTPTPEPIAEDARYTVEFLGSEIVKDYEDKPALMVTYKWTNNSDETTNAAIAITTQAFQDGLEMDTTFVSSYSDPEHYKPYDNLMTDVRPGYSLEVAKFFLLGDSSSDVEVEWRDWSNFFGDNLLAIEMISVTS